MRYVALLRGIMPMNPNMRGEKLRGVFEDLGFKNVATVIGSGNVVFDSPSKSVAALEAKIEKAWPEKLGFKSTTIIRNKEELEKLVTKDPYKKFQDARYYQLVTFLKNHNAKLRTFPKKGKGYGVVGVTKKELFAYLDRKEGGSSPDYMRILEKQLNKEITSRTFQTVLRILKKMD